MVGLADNAARQLLDQARNGSVWMTIYLAQSIHVVEPRTFGCDRRADSRIEISWAKNAVLVAAERERPETRLHDTPFYWAFWGCF